jgi:hypothetical protein
MMSVVASIADMVTVKALVAWLVTPLGFDLPLLIAGHLGLSGSAIRCRSHSGRAAYEQPATEPLTLFFLRVIS